MKKKIASALQRFSNLIHRKPFFALESQNIQYEPQ